MDARGVRLRNSAAVQAHSVVLLAFGSDSFVELLSASVVLLQFSRNCRISKARAAYLAGSLLFVLAALVTAVAGTALYLGVQPQASVLGIIVTVGALVIMPILAFLKQKNAQETNDRALAADSTQSATCAYLAAITLCSLFATMLFGIRWLDSVAALCAVPVLIVEGKRAFRGGTCGCCG